MMWVGRLWFMPHRLWSGGVGHSLQSMLEEIFACRAHFPLIAERQTSPCVEGDMEI